MEPIILCLFSITPLQKWVFLEYKFPWKGEIREFSFMLINTLVVEPGRKLFFKKLISFSYWITVF